MALPYGTTGSLSPTFVPAQLWLAVKLPYTAHSANDFQPFWGTFRRLRYRWRRPPQSIARQTLSPIGITYLG